MQAKKRLRERKLREIKKKVKMIKKKTNKQIYNHLFQKKKV